MRQSMAGLAAFAGTDAAVRAGAQQASPAAHLTAVQEAPASPAPATTQSTAAPNGSQAKPVKQPNGSERRRAAKLYLSAAKLYETGTIRRGACAIMSRRQRSIRPTRITPGRRGDARACRHRIAPDSGPGTYQGRHGGQRGLLWRGHAVSTQPIRRSRSIFRNSGTMRLRDRRSHSTSRLPMTWPDLTDLDASHDRSSFHLHATQRAVIQKVFKAYGIDATLDESIRGNVVRFDLDDATFAEATRARLAADAIPSSSRSTRIACW